MRTIDTSCALERLSVPALDQVLGHAFPVLDHGFIRIIDYMGNDSSVIQAARTSYGSGTKEKNSDEGLIHYLLRHEHTTPFEMCELKLHVKLPIFVARQWIRHRMANVNEYSGRYSVLDREFYIPDADKIAKQSSTNKQGRGEIFDDDLANEIRAVMQQNAEECYSDYQLLHLEGDFKDDDGFSISGYGVSRELSRIVLPANIYTQWYWKTDLHNLLRFMRLRADSHAQYEIRAYAETIEHIVASWVPQTFHAYMQYQKNSVRFSDIEMDSLATILNTEQGRIMINAVKQLDTTSLPPNKTVSKGEWKEFLDKLTKIEARFK